MSDEEEGNLSVEVRLLGPGDAHVLARVAAEVFDNAIDADLAAEFLADRRHHLAVALDGDTVVGMASAVDYIHPDKPVELWINEVGVAPAYRNAGVGRRLLHALFARGRELGCRDAWVCTEVDNHAAHRLYTSAGGAAESILMYSFQLDTGQAPS